MYVYVLYWSCHQRTLTVMSQERHFHLCASSAQETGDEVDCASGSHTSLWHTRPQAVQHGTIMRNAFLNTKGGSQNVDLTQRLFFSLPQL